MEDKKYTKEPKPVKRPLPSQQVFQIQNEMIAAGTPLSEMGLVMLVLTAQLDKLEEICLLLNQK